MGFLLALVKIVPWVVGLVGGAYATKKITESFGSTPANDLRKVPGLEQMSSKQMYNDQKEWRRDRIKYHIKNEIKK